MERNMSTHLFFPPGKTRQRLYVGPLSDDIDSFAAYLARVRYTRRTACGKLRIVRNLSVWLACRDRDLATVTESRLQEFVLRRGAQSKRREASTIRELLRHLRETGRFADQPQTATVESPIKRIVRRYERFLINERGLSNRTVVGYRAVVQRFLTERFGCDKPTLETLAIQDVHQFILRHSKQRSYAHARYLRCALRSFLLHLYQNGETSVDLASAVVRVIRWRLTGVAKSLPRAQVDSILMSCDRNTVVGRRDYAMLLLIARLGLRAREVAALTLDDIDWKNGVLTVRGKGRRQEALPLIHEVGEALSSYLCTGRPPCSTRCVFVRIQAPHRALRSGSVISQVLRRAVGRAKLDPPVKGVNLLRHSMATGMLRDGASLEEIGQVMRHRHPDTTQIYAKHDVDSLRALAPFWPGGAT